VSAFGDHRADIAGKLTAAGVPGVTLNPSALPPFVLVGLVQLSEAQGVGGWAGTMPVTAVAPPPGDAAAAAALEDTAELVLRTLGFAPLVPDTYDAAGKSVPAYVLTYPVSITNPDC